MVGVLVEIGRNKKSIDHLEFYLNNFSEEPKKFTAPPSGLFLEKVLYDDKIKLNEIESASKLK
jgi:tRNA pseudouridine38-40 synthase